MPRIINAYDGNSALGDALGKLGESLYGDGARYEVYRQKARGEQNINDLAADGTVGLDDPRLAKAQLAIGGNASGTFAGQGRALANDRFTNAATNATSERNNVRTNAETHYGTDRRYDSDIATTGMNNNTSLGVARIQGDTSRDVAGIQGDNQHRTQVDIANRTPVKTFDPATGTYHYAPQSEVNAGHMTPVITPDEAKGNAVAGVFQRMARQQSAPPASPFNDGAPPWNAGAGTPAPQPAAVQAPAPRPGTVNAGAYGNLTPQEASLIGVPRQAMIHPATGKTGYSYDNGATLADGSPAAGFIPATDADVLARERDNNAIKAASVPLAPRPEGFSQYAEDAGKTSGVDSLVQHGWNKAVGFLGGPEVGSNYNDARRRLENTNQSIRQLIESAPGSRAAVAREKRADELLAQPGDFTGMTGASAPEERQRATSVTDHLRDVHALVQSEAQDPNTPPAERAAMLQWLHRSQNAIAQLEKPVAAAPTAGAQPAAPAAPTAGKQLPTLTPEQAAAVPSGTQFLTTDGQVRVKH